VNGKAGRRLLVAHVGAHPQKQPDLNWIGVVFPVGRLTGDQMRGLAATRATLAAATSG
jgi:hypothetical protein